MTLTGPNPVFKLTTFLKSNISGTQLLENTNRKPHPIYRMVPLSMTLSDLWPGFQGHDIFCSRISETARIKDKVTSAQEEKYLTMTFLPPCSQNSSVPACV